MVSVDVKHHVYLLTQDEVLFPSWKVELNVSSACYYVVVHHLDLFNDKLSYSCLHRAIYVRTAPVTVAG